MPANQIKYKMKLQKTTNIKMLLSCSCLLRFFAVNWAFFYVD